MTEDFNPNAPGSSNTIYGLPFNYNSANIVLVPFPWEVTVSSGTGAAKGPEAIYNASHQVDLFDPLIPNAWKAGIHMMDINPYTMELSNDLRTRSEKLIQKLYDNNPFDDEDLENLSYINSTTEKEINKYKIICKEALEDHKLVGLIGGDHSTPLALVRALCDKHEEIAILQLDAHYDLRKAYEGFTHSHASIMYNCAQLKSISQIVHVGIRDYCEEERIESSTNGKSISFTDFRIKEALFKGVNWDEYTKNIISSLKGNKVYVSFDIDGLKPEYCPGTGTPVPGGLEFEQAIYLLEKLVESGKTIVGFDLCEVAPLDSKNWDGNVGARIAYKLSNLMAISNGIKL